MAEPLDIQDYIDNKERYLANVPDRIERAIRAIVYTETSGSGGGMLPVTLEFDIVGDATTTSWTFTHGFNTRVVSVEIYNVKTFATCLFDVERTSDTEIKVSSGTPLGVGNNYKVIVRGKTPTTEPI